MPVAQCRVFMHHDGALGDVLLSLPCLRKIRETAAFLHMACRLDIGEFLQQTGLADGISRVDSIRYSPLYADLPHDWSCGTLSSFDRAYLFTARETPLARNLRQCIPDVRIIRTIPSAEAAEHAARFRLRQCGNGDEFAASAPLALPEESEKWAERLLAGWGFQKGMDRLFAVHAGSGGLKKCWPLRNYLDVISRVAGDGHIWCAVFSGPAEPPETVSALQELAATHRRVIHLVQEPLCHVAAILNLSDHYLGNDSGISHLAGAMLCQGTVLFGPTDPRIWRPFSQGMETIQFMQDGDGEPVTARSLGERILSVLRVNSRQ